MTKEIFEELKKEMFDDSELDVYDWLCQYSRYITQEETFTIAKELAYALYIATQYTTKEDRKTIQKDLWEELEGRIYIDEEEDN